MFYQYDKPPTLNPEVRQQLRSGGTYAALAAIFGSWRPSTIEMRARGRGTPNRTNEVKSLSHGFSYYLNGGLPQERTIKTICDDYERLHGERAAKPACNLLWHWWSNPLAELLCVPSENHDHVLKQLEQVPIGPARDLIWQLSLTTIGMAYVTREVPDTAASVERLAEMEDYPALLALLGKMRLRQLQGRLDLDVHYERAIWRILPGAIASSAHLAFVRDHVVAAVCQFMTWKPYAELRGRSNYPYEDPTALRREIDRRIDLARLRGVSMPPVDVEFGRRADTDRKTDDKHEEAARQPKQSAKKTRPKAKIGASDWT